MPSCFRRWWLDPQSWRKSGLQLSRTTCNLHDEYQSHDSLCTGGWPSHVSNSERACALADGHHMCRIQNVPIGVRQSSKIRQHSWLGRSCTNASNSILFTAQATPQPCSSAPLPTQVGTLWILLRTRPAGVANSGHLLILWCELASVGRPAVDSKHYHPTSYRCRRVLSDGRPRETAR